MDAGRQKKNDRSIKEPCRKAVNCRKPVSGAPFRCSYEIGDVRIQLLSDTLVRIENRKDSGDFENRESYIVTNRLDWQGTDARVLRTDGGTKIVAPGYTVMIPDGGKAEQVTVTDKNGKLLYSWAGTTGMNIYLPSPSDELGSWYFTDSPRIIPSCAGYSDEGLTNLQNWDFGSRATDIFVFLPGGSYGRFLEDFVRLTGRSEMVELRTLGFWDSRYYAYSEETALRQIRDYRDRGYAIDMLVIDTDWRENKGTRGIGYDVNTELFPDMKRFLRECHEAGVGVCFNDHPEPVAGTKNGLDGAEVRYRNEKLKGLLSIGLDVWWYDRNWETSLLSADPGISVYAFGMYAFHRITEDYYRRLAGEQEYARRAVIMGNVDGVMHGEWKYASDLSAHRYPVQWTGDICGESADLAQEICTAVFGGAEVGIPYVSSDLGGHLGTPTEAQYIRWIQYGMLTPFCRVHCWARDGSGRMPWLFGDRAEAVFRAYQGIRYRLLPLFYLLVRENYDRGLPLMRRLDIRYPQYPEASRNDEYLLGDGILVAPPAQSEPENDGGQCRREVFFPDGTWIDVFSGKRYTGPCSVTVSHPLDTSPLYVREGSLVILAQNGINTGDSDWSRLSLDVYPSAKDSAVTRLYEDDTKTVAYRDGQFRTTELSMHCDREKRTVTVRIDAANGTFEGKRASDVREWNIRVHKNPGWGNLRLVTVNGERIPAGNIRRSATDSSVVPFAFCGAAADGDVWEFPVSGRVDTEYEIGLSFEAVAAPVESCAYDRQPIGFTLTKNGEVQSVDLSHDGTLGWVSFGDGGTVSATGDTQLFSYPRTRVCGSGRAKEQSVVSLSPMVGSVQKIHCTADGQYSGNDAVYTNPFFDLEIRTVGRHARYVLILGGVFSTAKVTVRDRGGNVRTVSFGSLAGEWSQKVTIEVPGTEVGTLYVHIAVVCAGRSESPEYPAATRLKHPAALKLYGCCAEDAERTL